MATVASLVFLPRITSTSGICRTGLKKCRPQNRSGCSSPSASCVIGMVDVFEAQDRVVAHQRLEPGEQLLLGFALFDDRLDDHVGVAELDVGERAVDQRRDSTARFTSGPLICLL